MLKRLKISNIILIEKMEIFFDKGLNILTGETGAGKSSVLQAITLALGERADSSIIRKGAQKAFIEAAFETPNQPLLIELLSNAGIEIHSLDELIIRREISNTGKNRAFINDQLTSLGIIESAANFLVDVVGQHSHQKLLSLSFHREILDAFGKHQSSLKLVKHAWEQFDKLRAELETLAANTPVRLREIDRLKIELAEIENAKLREGEEEELFQEYSRLSHTEEITKNVQELLYLLSDSKTPVLSTLRKQKGILEQTVALDETLDDTLQTFQASLIELEEISYSLSRYLEKLNPEPDRLRVVNERLTLITHIKRKYGKNLDEIEVCKQQLQTKLADLLELDQKASEIGEILKNAEAEYSLLANELSQSRQIASSEFQKLITHEIQSLNMPKASFHIKITPQIAGPKGIDKIECFFSPNVGEEIISLKDCASGGELSRLMLAIKTILAGKDQVPTLIFDEIDANLGGETACIVGDKLQALGLKYQVLSITHLPQIASRGDSHLKVFKEEQEGRTFAQIVKLDIKSRQQELARMLGGAGFSEATQDLAEMILRK